MDLFPYERHIHSQNGEDGILAAIFASVGEGIRYFVEFGAGEGKECNSARLVEQGWTGLLMDGRPWAGDTPLEVHQEFITAENINALFEKHRVPESFDLLSIDIDGNDYWVWKALSERYRPRVVVVEYNANVDPTLALTIPYDPGFRWDGSDYYGASLGALQALGAAKGYVLVGCDSSGVNAFFVEKSLAEGRFPVRDVLELYRPPIYGAFKCGQPRNPSKSLVPVGLITSASPRRGACA